MVPPGSHEQGVEELKSPEGELDTHSPGAENNMNYNASSPAPSESSRSSFSSFSSSGSVSSPGSPSSSASSSYGSGDPAAGKKNAIFTIPTVVTPTCMSRRCPSRKTMGVSLMVLGPVLIALGLGMHYGIRKAFPSQIRAMAVMDSPHHSRFKAWETNAGHGGAIRQYAYTFQAVTNPEEVLEGKAPVYENKGPYVFDRTYKRVGVQFEDDGNAVTFSERYRSSFNAKASAGSADDDVTIFNPAWHQVMSMYGSETGLSKGSGSLILLKLGRAFRNEFLFTSGVDALRTGLSESAFGFNLALKMLKYPDYAFETAWGGQCVTNSKGEKLCGIKDASALETSGLLKEKNSRLSIIAGDLCAVPGMTAYPIPPEVSKRIWNATDKYSVLNFEEEGATLTKQGIFHGLTTWVRAATNVTARRELADWFKITDKQVDVVASHLAASVNNTALFAELKARYLASLPEEKASAMEQEIQTREDMLWRQFYAADVIPVLKKNATASIKEEAHFEYGLFAQTDGRTLEDMGVSLENLKCLFNYAEANRTDLELRLWGYQRMWYKGGELDDLSGEFQAYKTVPAWDACFPNAVALANLKDYVNYLIDILFIPEFEALSKTDGIIATKAASAWVLGDGPLELFSEALLDEDDPRINFALLSHDEDTGGFQSDAAYCHQSSDAVNIYNSCHRNPEDKNRFYRGNLTMYTGKDDVNKVGQWKRLYGKETLDVWQSPMPIDHGATKLHAAYPWERHPLLPGYIDGLSVPPGLLHDAPLDTTYLSLFMESLNAPFAVIYEKDVRRWGIPLKRFVFHPDAFSQNRPDAVVFSQVDPQAPVELQQTLNLSVSRAAYFFMGPRVSLATHNQQQLADTPAVVTAGAEKNDRQKKGLRALASVEVEAEGGMEDGMEGGATTEVQGSTGRGKKTEAKQQQQQQQQQKGANEEDISYIEIEPTTGMTMRVNIVMQAYMSLLPQYLTHEVFSPHVYAASRVPFFECRISQHASPAQRREFKMKVEGAQRAAVGVQYGGIVVGLMTFCGGVYLLWRERQARKEATNVGGEA